VPQNARNTRRHTARRAQSRAANVHGNAGAWPPRSDWNQATTQGLGAFSRSVRRRGHLPAGLTQTPVSVPNCAMMAATSRRRGRRGLRSRLGHPSMLVRYLQIRTHQRAWCKSADSPFTWIRLILARRPTRNVAGISFHGRTLSADSHPSANIVRICTQARAAMRVPSRSR
jgi:hypothetical protein